MPKETADCVEVNSLVEEMGRKAVAKGVDAAGLCYAGFFLLFTKTFLAAA
jgi:hypothetical protein